MTTETPTTSRRAVLRGSAGALAATTALGATAGTARAAPSFDGWFENVSNYDGVVDKTGQSEARIVVGANANGGAFGYGPAAVRVDPGTKVLWEWNGKGGSHNVEAEDGSYKSELTGEEGFTFERTFEEEGVSKYFCLPHKAMGMKGAIVVGDAGGASGAGGGSAGAPATGNVEYLFVGVLAGAILTVLGLLPLSESRARKHRAR